MITSAQYEITKREVQRFKDAIDALPNVADPNAPELTYIMRDAMKSQLADLEKEIKDYETQ